MIELYNTHSLLVAALATSTRAPIAFAIMTALGGTLTLRIAPLTLDARAPVGFEFVPPLSHRVGDERRDGRAVHLAVTRAFEKFRDDRICTFDPIFTVLRKSEELARRLIVHTEVFHDVPPNFGVWLERGVWWKVTTAVFRCASIMVRCAFKVNRVHVVHWGSMRGCSTVDARCS